MKNELEFTSKMLNSMKMKVPKTCLIKGCGKIAEYFDDDEDITLCFKHYHDISDELEKEDGDCEKALFENLENHDEEKAKKEQKVCCHDCKYFLGNCEKYIGKYHKTCKKFEWW